MEVEVPGAGLTLCATLVHTLEGHTAGVHCCSLLGLGRTLGVSGSGDGVVRVWDLVWGSCLRRLLPRHANPSAGLGVEPLLNCVGSKCGRWVFACTQQRLVMWAWRESRVLLQHTTNQVELNASLAVAPDGRVVYSTKEGAVYMGSVVFAGQQSN